MWWLPLWIARRRNDMQSERKSRRRAGGCVGDGLSFDFPTVRIRARSRSSGSLEDEMNGNNANGQQQQQQQQHAQTTMLYRLAGAWAWDAVSIRCQSHPTECSTRVVNERGDNVLHWAAFGRSPVEVVRQLLTTCPALAQQPNKHGSYPLHVASSYRAVCPVIELLLQAYPDAAGIPTRSGCHVLHLMCDYGTHTPDAIRFVLQTKAGVSTIRTLDPNYQRRPLHIMNGRKNLRKCQRARDSMRGLRVKIRSLENSRKRRTGEHAVNNDGNCDNDKETEEEICRLKAELMEYAEDDVWKKVSLLLVAEYTQRPIPTNGVVDPRDVLHASIHIEDCPTSFQEYAILLHEEYLLTSLTSTSNNSDVVDGDLPLHVAARRRNAGLILDLLVACPAAAAVRNAHDQLPLQLALSSAGQQHSPNQQLRQKQHWDDGIGALVEAHPAALGELLIPDAVYPIIWARLAARESSLFRAVRMCPNIFSG